MNANISVNHLEVAGKSYKVYCLETVQAKLNVWPEFGFNALSWQIKKQDGSWGDIFYHSPDWQTNPLPTRSGHPVLFPFPNRLEFGRMNFEGRKYQLPLTESTKTHSIHGFTPRTAWQVCGTATTELGVSITAIFTTDMLPDSDQLWPSKATIILTYTLNDQSLTVDAVVENRGQTNLPYGLGYHAYFRHPYMKEDEKVDDCLFLCDARKIWICNANIPNGNIETTPIHLNFNSERSLGNVEFDTLLTEIRTQQTKDNKSLLNNKETGHFSKTLNLISVLGHPAHKGSVTILADDSFPHLVLFTPAHRKAIAIEPYTCATNAPNLPSQLPHGWKILLPNMKNFHRVKYLWN